ncbi:hypothetical protein RINTHH_21190 [Richelia intracellularis HH01]|uniref:Uncharacterized protein n=1 Tax=Richelia intracellularis HH01 TaxID=1165094 RepID=M1WTQ2_9NOST|nr:hypothetical protein RINTHH_21190 [Richelia intracellularis HH01]
MFVYNYWEKLIQDSLSYKLLLVDLLVTNPNQMNCSYYL